MKKTTNQQELDKANKPTTKKKIRKEINNNSTKYSPKKHFETKTRYEETMTNEFNLLLLLFDL